MDKINIVSSQAVLEVSSLACTYARCLPHHWSEIWTVWRPQVGCKKVHCLTVLLEHKVVTRDSAYRWQWYDVIMTWWSSIEQVSKRYHQNFLLCNNNEITTCIADLLNRFCEEAYAVAFFKVVQQQTIGEVGNSICERIIKIEQYMYLRKLCSNEKRSSFWLTVYIILWQSSQIDEL